MSSDLQYVWYIIDCLEERKIYNIKPPKQQKIVHKVTISKADVLFISSAAAMAKIDTNTNTRVSWQQGYSSNNQGFLWIG